MRGGSFHIRGLAGRWEEWSLARVIKRNVFLNYEHGAVHKPKLPNGQMLPISDVQGEGKYC